LLKVASIVSVIREVSPQPMLPIVIAIGSRVAAQDLQTPTGVGDGKTA
jgi:hypothetical protein